MNKKLLLQADGGSRGNPGPAAYGYVITDITPGSGIILEKCGNYIGTTTNNQAEYLGLIAGLTWVLTHASDVDLLIKLDSLLIVNQIKGLYKVKSPDLQPLYFRTTKLLSKLASYQITHTLRAGNSLADSLVNQALDNQLL